MSGWHQVPNFSNQSRFLEQTSTISRVLYLQIANFLNNTENSSHFRAIQKNQYYLANFITCFLVWLLKKMEDPQEIKIMRTKLDSLKRGKELLEYFSGKEIGSRLIETVANYQLVSEMLSSFFSDRGITESECKEFLKQSKNALFELGKATHLKCLNYKPLYKIAMQNVLPNLKIKDCRYGETYLNKASDIEARHPTNYDRSIYSDNLLTDYVPDIKGFSRENDVKLFGSLYLFGMTEEYDGILFKREKQETLLVKSDVLCDMMVDAVSSYAEQWNINLHKEQLTDTVILTGLSESKLIYGYKRIDGFRKMINFPIFSINTAYCQDELDLELLWEMHKMLKINTSELNCSDLPVCPLIRISEFYEQLTRFNQCYHTDARDNAKEYIKILHNTFIEMDRYVNLK